MENKRKTMLVVAGVIAAIAVGGTALLTMNIAYTTTEPVSNPDCLSVEDIRSIMSSFKTPQYLPAGYEYKCGTGNSTEVNTLYWDGPVDKAAFSENIEEFVKEQEGAILLRMARQPQITNGTAETIREYNNVLEGNPDLKPQLLDINGKVAWGHEIAINGGKQTATWPDGTTITNSFDVPARIRMFEDGTIIRLEGYVPLKELVDMTKSLQ